MSWWGDTINSITGTSTSAKKAYKYNLALQENAQAFNAAEAQKERDWQTQMSNTEHQRAVADLQAAGLNPVLAAGGGNTTGAGAVASSSGGGGVGTPAGVDPITMANAVVDMINSSKMTNAEVNKINAEKNNIDADTELTKTTNKNASTRTTQNENDENFAKTWWGRNISPVLRDIFGGGGAAAGAIAGAAVSQAATSAKKARTPKKNKIGF